MTEPLKINELFNTPAREASDTPGAAIQDDVGTIDSFGNALYHSLVTAPVADIGSLFAGDDDAQKVISNTSRAADINSEERK